MRQLDSKRVKEWEGKEAGLISPAPSLGGGQKVLHRQRARTEEGHEAWPIRNHHGSLSSQQPAAKGQWGGAGGVAGTVGGGCESWRSCLGGSGRSGGGGGSGCNSSGLGL